MATTPTADPSTAIFDVAGDDKGINVPLYFLQVLRRDWTAANTDNVTPTMDLSTEHKTKQFGNGDWITVYEASESVEPIGVSYVAEHRTFLISFEILTSYNSGSPPAGPNHMVKVMGEIRRIMHGVKTQSFGAPATTGLRGNVWVKHIRTTNLDKINKLFYRRILDYEVRVRYEATHDNQ